MRRRRLLIAMGFNWRDLWVGAYVSKDRRVLFVCPLPCVVIAIGMRGRYDIGWDLEEDLRWRIS